MAICEKKCRIGWEKNGKWKYLTVNSHEEMLEEIADKTILSDKVSVRVVRSKRKQEVKGEVR